MMDSQGFLPPAAITALADMFTPPDEDSDSDTDQPASSISALNPGNIGPAKTAEDTKTTKSKKDTKDIWDEEEVQEGAELQSTYDPPPTARYFIARSVYYISAAELGLYIHTPLTYAFKYRYDIVFKQAVTSEDMFLQMGNKNPSTASCEDMVVKVKLPGTKLADVTLDVKSKFIDCRTPKFYLGLHLPQPVDHKSGKAQWDGKTETLSITLRMKREYDFMNL